MGRWYSDETTASETILESNRRHKFFLRQLRVWYDQLSPFRAAASCGKSKSGIKRADKPAAPKEDELTENPFHPLFSDETDSEDELESHSAGGYTPAHWPLAVSCHHMQSLSMSLLFFSLFVSSLLL